MNQTAMRDNASIDRLGDDRFFVVGSELMQKIRAQAELLAQFHVPVLILGESGTGKEVMAKLIHTFSARATGPFLKVNCAAFPSELLESELFGYESGAFTGATRTRRGKFELCAGGTILLDEVAEMPAPLQPKLLHVLQDKQFFRLGGETTIRVDVRILAATNVDVHKAIAQGKFREDLYYRLAAFTIQLPPLRERTDEIQPLLDHFMARIAAQHGRAPLPYSQTILEACLNYSWPGNVRELENFVSRYVVLADEALALSELGPKTNGNGGAANHGNGNGNGNHDNGNHGNGLGKGHSGNGSSKSLKDIVQALKDDTEVRAISEALEETRWNRREAARLLHISYRGLLYKIQQHHIVRAVEARTATPAEPGGPTA